MCSAVSALSVVETVDVAVVGAGVTGLACALMLAERGLSTVILERHPRPGLDTSTHNSGVIHAGLYYPPGSLKAALCVEGRRMLYAFCERHNVPHSRCGKLIVASEPSEVAQFDALLARGRENGVEGLELVDRAFIAKREPAIRAAAAIYSPDTGIVDAEALVRALLHVAESHGAIFLPGTALLNADRTAGGLALDTGRETIYARTVINAAGLYADDVSQMCGGTRFTIYPCRGEYAELTPSKRPLVNALVYPLPHGHGLGVHLTRSMGGNVWIGPTARYQDRKDDYESDRLSLDDFVEPTRALLPSITPDDMRLSGSGIRPKLHPPSEPFADFLIERDALNPMLVQVAGIESPGLTACLAIGQLVSRLVG